MYSPTNPSVPTAAIDPARVLHKCVIHSAANTAKHNASAALLDGEMQMDREKQLWKALYDVLKELWYNLVSFSFLCALSYSLVV